VHDLIVNATRDIMHFGQEAFTRTAERARKEVEETRQVVEALAAEADRPDLTKIRTVLEEVREIGLQKFWQTASHDEQRVIIQNVIRTIRILPIPEGRRMQVGGVIELWDEWKPYGRGLPRYPRGDAGSNRSARSLEQREAYHQRKAKGESDV
jgi:hypothetical protein